LDKVLDIVNVNSIVAILVFVVIQIWIQKTTIKNNNIVISRLNWLKNLKKNFVEYNTALEKLIEFDRKADTENEQHSEAVIASITTLDTLYQVLKNKKIDLTMQFKAYETDENDKFQNVIESALMNVNQDKSDINLNLGDYLKKPDDCERQFLKLTDIIDEFYAKKRNPINKVSIIEDEILLGLIQQFEICICKNEWTKINSESNIFYTHIAFSHKEKNSLKILKNNSETIINKAIENWRSDNKDSSKSLPHSKYSKTIDEIWKDPDNNTVGDKLKVVLTGAAKNKGKYFPSSMKTSSGKRYIYSIDAPVHPNGKNFFNPKKFKLPELEEDIYLETNFSNNQAKSIAEQIMKKNGYKKEEEKNL